MPSVRVAVIRGLFLVFCVLASGPEEAAGLLRKCVEEQLLHHLDRYPAYSLGREENKHSRRISTASAYEFSEKEEPWPGLGQGHDWDPMEMASGDLNELEQSHNASKEGMYLRSRPLDKRFLAFHWAVISCERRGAMRVLGTAIMTALAHEMVPASITIIWCKPYNASDVPSLFHNIRFSRKVRVLYLPDKLQKMDLDKFRKNQIAFMRALSVPKYLGKPKLPVLVTEDDVMFIPDFNARLRSAVDTIHKFLGPAPRPNYLINLYRPSPPGTMPDDALVNWYDGVWNGIAPKDAGSIHVAAGGETFIFGAQALFFSPMMASRMLSHITDVFYGYFKFEPSFTDMLVLNFLKDRYNCTAQLPWNMDLIYMKPGLHTKQVVIGNSGGRCISFRITPCMVQHTGKVSSVFQGLSSNSRFHVAETFPFKISFPSSDAPNMW